MQSTKVSGQEEPAPFALKIIKPFSTFENGIPKPIPYLVDGLLPESGFSILAAKPKHGKSSLARYLAVCVAKGTEFLGRAVRQGEVIVITLEDPLNHADNCIKALGYDPATDAAIHLVPALSPDINASLRAIDDALAKLPSVRLVVVDTLAKLLRVTDANDYGKVLPQVEKVHDLARKHPHIHVLGLAHCKKVATDDPFDALLGSTALRGETDTNIAIYDDQKQKVIAAETRIGRNIPPTMLHADLVESAGANVVKNFQLEGDFGEWSKAKSDKAETKRRRTYEERIICFLQDRPDFTATKVLTLEEVEGNKAAKIEAINQLALAGVIVVTGKGSRTSPQTLRLNEHAIRLHEFVSANGGGTQ